MQPFVREIRIAVAAAAAETAKRGATNLRASYTVSTAKVLSMLVATTVVIGLSKSYMRAKSEYKLIFFCS